MSAVRKVLVVDDDPVISESFHRVLARKGYLVVSAADGLEALNKVATETYDAVFTDIKMPGMDGVEVAEQMRTRRPWTQVVIITGYGSAENETRAKAAGVHAFLRKPLSPEMIEGTLAAAVALASPETQPLEAEPPEAELAEAEPLQAAFAAAPEPAAALEISVHRSTGRVLYDIGMFFAAPFVTLAYVLLFPFIGLAVLARLVAETWHNRKVTG